MQSTTNVATTTSSKIGKFKVYYDEHEQQIDIGFFVGGFLLDLLMLDSIDSFSTIGQQGLYLLIIFISLCHLFFEQAKPPIDSSAMFLLKRWYYDYRTVIVHFFFGSLLSSYTLFFFKSSSLIMSLGFVAVMAGLLVANESQRFKRSELSVKFGLLGLCFLCFFAALTPMMAGSMGIMVFLLSMLLGCLPLILLGWWIQSKRPSMFLRAKKQILIPMSIVVLSFLTLYMLKLIPPVPLSIPFVGVYHSVEKAGSDYSLGHERPWWRFWKNGDQIFQAQRGDKIYVFFRLFSPARFSDQVTMKWFWKENSQGWILQDGIPIRIVGGRQEGFRGYGVKSNYQPGEWKVQIETNDGREIGRIYFDLLLAPEVPRTFEYVTM